ncbi:MAG: HAD-IB family hydrolase [Spirochaetota bacterium]|nr:HAD-IB family hydrolase [Spirochaetota bacterium]
MQDRYFAFFDLDHTLTRADTGFAFLRWWARRHPWVLWRFLLAPLALLLWKAHIISLRHIKEFFFSVLHGKSAAEVDAAARAFVDDSFEKLVKEDARLYLAEIAPLYHLVLASASPEFYVRYFAEKLGFALYVATLYEFRDGIFTGRMEGPDCRGEEKMRRILGRILLTRYDREHSLAFSDNVRLDAPLLSLAGNAFRVHRTKWRFKPVLIE